MMSTKQALAWAAKYNAEVTRHLNGTYEHSWCVRLRDGTLEGGATLVEAVEKARDAITVGWRVDTLQLHGDRRFAKSQEQEARDCAEGQDEVLVRIVKRVKR